MQSKETRAGINILNSVYNSKTQRKLQAPSPLQPVHCTVRVRCLTTTLSLRTGASHGTASTEAAAARIEATGHTAMFDNGQRSLKSPISENALSVSTTDYSSDNTDAS